MGDILVLTNKIFDLAEGAETEIREITSKLDLKVVESIIDYS